jgi:dipeptidyl aminopeptidase/acylaminoacyl peptidase
LHWQHALPLVPVSGAWAADAPAANAPAPAPAARPFDAASAFGARRGVIDMAISPDGKRLAVVIPRPVGGEAVTVLNLDGDAKPQLALTSKGITEQVLGCHWVSNDRLLCSVWFAEGAGRSTNVFTRSVALNADGSNAKVIGTTKASNATYRASYGGSVIDLNGGGDGVVLLQRQFVPGMGTGTLIRNSLEGIGVVRIDTATGRETVVEQPKLTMERFIADGSGKVRIMGLQPRENSGYAGNRIVYSYRPAEGGDWRPLSEQTILSTGASAGFQPVAVDPALNVAYGFAEKDGYSALFRQALDGSNTPPELVLAKPGVDVDALIRIGRSQRVVGVSYATDMRSVEFFDPQLSRLATSLQRALPGKTQIGFVDASADENRLILFVGSDTDPGRYFLYDKTTHRLGELLAERPQLANARLSEVKPILYTAADGSRIPAYLTLPPGSDGRNLPAIVMPHGGPSARDEWGFDWLSQYFAQRGYAVIQPNYRGSAGFGAAFLQKNGFQSWRTAIGDVNDAGRWLVAQGIAAPDKLAIVGWSYGSYAALQAQVLDPNLFKAAVAVAPVADLGQLREESINRGNYQLVSDFIGEGPHVAEGSPARHAEVFKAPVLLFHGDRDLNVAVAESRLMQSRLRAAGKAVEYVEFPGLDHQLDDSAARSRLLATSDAFLRKAMGLPTP